MRFHGGVSGKDKQLVHDSPSASKEIHKNRLLRAIYAMHEARKADGRAFGELLRQSVSSSLRLIIIVGGLVVFFSVMMELLIQTGWLSGLYAITEQLLLYTGFPLPYPTAS